MQKEADIPSFIYTSAHSRDLDAIKKMSAELETYEWRKFDPRLNISLGHEFSNSDGWEVL